MNYFMKWLLACIFLIAPSCNKNDSGISLNYPSAFFKSGYQIIGTYRLFANTGEIKSAPLINRFYTMDTANFNYTASVIKNFPGPLDSVQFPDEQQATVFEYFQWRKTQVSRMGSKLVLTKTDTTLGYTNFDELTHNVMYYLGEIKPEVFNESIYSVSGGIYFFQYRAMEKYVLVQSSGQLYAPILQYGFYRNGLNIHWFLNNVLDKDFYKFLPAGDTISLREARLLFKQ